MSTPSSAVPDHLAEIVQLKAKGNEQHKQHNHAAAASEYSKAIALLERAAAAPDDENDDADDSVFAKWFPFFAAAAPSRGEQRRLRPRGSTGGALAQQPPAPIASPSLARRSEPALTKLSFAELLDRDAGAAANGAAAPSPEVDLLASLYSNRALAYTLNRQLDLAWVDTNTVIRLRPDWVKGYFRRGEVFLRTHRYKDAIQDFQTALSKEPANHSILERITRAKIHLEDDNSGLIFQQISVARGDICTARSVLAPIQNALFDFARNMRNFIYFVGDKESREVMVVDACWDIDGILKIAAAEKLTIVGAIVTHYHVDHVGGIPPPPYDKYGVRVDGLAKLLKKLPTIKAYLNPNDIPGLLAANPELPQDRLVSTKDGDVLSIPLKHLEKGQPPRTLFKWIHTPGHTPGSQCILVNGNRLLSGDTLFIGSCGRCDFPDSSPEQLGDSLEKLAALGDDVIVLPGHDYGGEFTSVQRERLDGLLCTRKRTEFVRRHVAHQQQTNKM